MREIDIKSRKDWDLSSKEYKERHREEQAEYYKKWYAENGRKRADNYSEKSREYNKTHKKECSVSAKAKYAISKGTIRKPKVCSRCGKERKILAHHPDYRFPFKVKFLCYSCHKLIHKPETTQ